MHYALLIREDASDFDKRENANEAGPYWASWSAYSQAIAQAGIFVSGAGLMPPAMATTVRIGDGSRDVQDGPFADAKEQLGGFFVIDVADLDLALNWAARADFPSRLGGGQAGPPTPAAGLKRMSEDGARSAAERIARHSYGKLVAYLSARTRDVPAAEDALSDALAKALQLWPERGVPDNPDAWLLVAARRNLAHKRRRGKVIAEGRDRVVLAIEELAHIMTEKAESDFPDDRLKLLFVCAHPAIDRTAHTPLMLQTVLGLDAKRIASAFLVSPATVGQRLVRAKAKIRDAGIPFTVPEPSEVPGRLDAVLAAIYAAYTLGWNDHGGSDEKASGLTTEAIWLARLLLTILPAKAEAIGLLSLMLYSQSRHRARRDEEGAYVPLEEQDPALWDAPLVSEADRLLVAAGKFNSFGPYQCQAAIQAVHAERRLSGTTNWQAIAMLYEALLKMRPTIGARVAQAAVTARLSGPEAGLQKLCAMHASDVQAYQPYWAVRAHLLGQTGAFDDARSAYGMAIGLSHDEAVRRHLQRRLMELRPTPTSR